jgi:DNA-binding transcriptional ArsR family regulator
MDARAGPDSEHLNSVTINFILGGGRQARSKAIGLGELHMQKIQSTAMKNKVMANALLGQAIIDEGFIGAGGSLEISYTSKQNAEWIWKIGNAFGLVHPLTEKAYKNHKKWIVKFRPQIRIVLKELGKFPDKRQQEMIDHIVDRNPKGGKSKYQKGEAKEKIINSLKESPKTIRNLSYDLDLSASTVKGHVYELNKRGLVVLSGLDKKNEHKNQRTSKIWKMQL